MSMRNQEPSFTYPLIKDGQQMGCSHLKYDRPLLDLLFKRSEILIPALSYINTKFAQPHLESPWRYDHMWEWPAGPQSRSWI